MRAFFKRYLMITLGCVLYGMGFAFFIKPSMLAPGGISGVAVILSEYIPFLSSGSIIFLLNLPLLITGASVFGWKFFAGTVWATVFSSFTISFCEAVFAPIQSADRLCCAAAGGIFIGIGIGLVFRENATTGGTDIIVRLLQKKFPYIRSGNIFMMVDSVVVISSGLVFRDLETSVYSGISLAVSTYIFNYILYGGMRAKLMIIITDDTDKLIGKLTDVTGITVLSGVGAYSKTSKRVMLCAVDKRKYPAATEIIKEFSPDSVVITAPADGYSHGIHLG